MRLKSQIACVVNARAYLGLGMLYRQSRAFDESIQILTAGIEIVPKAEQLHLCLAVSYMNVGRYQKALSFLIKLQHLKEGIYCIAKCYQALNDVQKAERYHKKYKAL